MSDNDAKQKSLLVKAFESDTTVKGIFLGTVATVSALVSFAHSLSSVKRKDSLPLDNKTMELYETGSQLAARALRWGTFYAITGCSLFVFGVWKLANVNNMEEFRLKMGKLFPKIPKNDPPQSRTDFETVSEFLQYLNDEYSTKKEEDKAD